ncbi:hypothetical protein LY76DRAFT_597615 [Colletotrichum caudatum]|nr:hypothetical protein LY76DRAFT_597615 [Colletotrichum caudatum]
MLLFRSPKLKPPLLRIDNNRNNNNSNDNSDNNNSNGNSDSYFVLLKPWFCKAEQGVYSPEAGESVSQRDEKVILATWHEHGGKLDK